MSEFKVGDLIKRTFKSTNQPDTYAVFRVITVHQYALYLEIVSHPVDKKGSLCLLPTYSLRDCTKLPNGSLTESIYV